MIAQRGDRVLFGASGSSRTTGVFVCDNRGVVWLAGWGSSVRVVSLTSYAVLGDHAVWDGLMLREWVDVLVARLVARFDPVRVVLFGSVADGTDGPDSDIDLLVVLDVAPRDDRRRIMVEMRRATRGVAAPHDLVVTSAADFARLGDSPGSTEFEPASHGLTVYERGVV